MSDQTAADKKEIEARYRAYCDVCQSGQLSKLTNFWALPAMFTVELATGDTLQKVIETSSELEKLYGIEFGHSTSVDKTVIDESDVKFFGSNLATIQTSLRHLVKGGLHDEQLAVYGCRKVNGEWVFFSHISKILGAAANGA